MAESEPKPKLIELAGPGAGQGWKAVLKSGKAAVVHEIPVPPAEAQAAVPRLQRLYDHRHPALSPVLAWGTDQAGVWVAVEPNEGTPLSTVLSHGPLTPPAAAALGAAVLSGVAALHEAGIAMGGFGAVSVRLTSNGDVRLAGHPAAAVRGTPSQSDLRADVRSCGMAVCAAFGVDPAGAPAPPNIPPGLVVTMRSMASGAMGPSADRAQAALREMAAALLAPDRQMAAQSELALRAGGREMPPITPFIPGTAAPQAPQPQAPAATPPAPYTPPVREPTPIRTPASYDAPDRPLQTYHSIPAPTFGPAPEAPPARPSVPTWADAPPKPAPWEVAPAAAAAAAASVPPPSTIPPSQAPAPEVVAPPPPAPTVTNPPAPAPSPLSTNPPAPSFATAPPRSAPEPPAAAPTAATAPTSAQPTWSAVEPPVWKPGDAVAEVPAEWVGSAAAADAVAPAAAAPTPAPPPVAADAKPTFAPAREPAVAAPVPVAAASSAVAPARRPTVARPSRGGGGTTFERPPWLVPAAIAVGIVLLLGIVGIVVLSRSGHLGATVANVTPSAKATGSPHSTPGSTPTAKGPLAVPVFAPASADPVTKVLFCSTATPCTIPGAASETATSCDIASSCKVEVGIYFSKGQKVPVSFSLKLFDRCTGQTTDLPGPPPFTPPGYAIVIPRDSWAVSLPSGLKSAALVAVTQQPATAASAPLMLGSDSCA